MPLFPNCDQFSIFFIDLFLASANPTHTAIQLSKLYAAQPAS